jgi:arylsulfatase A-like enzyme
VKNTNAIEPPPDPKYHLSEDLAQRGVDWLRRHRAFAPDKPFLLYWALGAGARPAPGSQGMGRQLQGPVRRRLGCLS